MYKVRVYIQKYFPKYTSNKMFFVQLEYIRTFFKKKLIEYQDNEKSFPGILGVFLILGSEEEGRKHQNPHILNL